MIYLFFFELKEKCFSAIGNTEVVLESKELVQVLHILAMKPRGNPLAFLNLNFSHMKLGGFEELQELNEII